MGDQIQTKKKKKKKKKKKEGHRQKQYNQNKMKEATFQRGRKKCPTPDRTINIINIIIIITLLLSPLHNSL